MQRSVIDEVLCDRKIEIKRTRLEYNAEDAECFTWTMPNVVTEYLNGPGLYPKQSRNERDESAFSGAVEPQQSDKCCRRHGKAHIVERLSGAIGMAQARNGKRGRLARPSWERIVRRSNMTDGCICSCHC